MTSKSRSGAGGLLAIVVGISYVLVGIIFFLMPAAQRPGGASTFGQYMASVADNAMPFTIYYAVFVLGAVAALGVIPAVNGFMKGEEDGWLVWAGNLGLVGFAVLIIDYLRFIAIVPVEAATFVQQDELGRFAISGDNFHLNLDPNGWLQFGLVGLWVIVVSIIALRRRTMPAAWSYVGIGAGLLYWLVVVANLLNVSVLLVVASALGGLVLVPIWFIWLGLRMRRPEVATAATSASTAAMAAE